MSQRVSDTVSGILVADGRFLVEERRQNDFSDPGLVAIPGGHVHPGETLLQALQREMREELGITVKEARFVKTERHVTSDGERQRIHYFLIERWEGTPTSKEATRIFWVSDIDKLGAIQDRRALEKTLSR